MNNITNAKKESISITKIRSILDQYDKLDYVTNEKDKVASFDGNIILRSKKSESKDTITGIIPIQIKSTEVSKFSRTSPSYQFDVSDISNFDLVDGVILFYVEIINATKAKIYYNALLPYDIAELKKESKGNQTKSIKFKELTNTRLNNIEIICTDFIYSKNIQKKVTIIPDADISNFKNIKFTVMASKKYLMDYLLQNEVYLYGEKINSDVQYLFSKVKIESIGTTITCPVYAGGRKYYNNIILENQSNQKIINIGKAVSISDNKEINIKFQGNLYEGILDCKFIISACETGEIIFEESTGNKKIILNKQKNEEEVKLLKTLLDRLQSTKSLFDFFEVKINIDMDKYTQKDINEISRFVDCVIKKKELEVPNPVGIYYFEVCKNKLCAFVRVQDGQQIITNYFNYDDKIKIFTVDSEERKCSISIYANLTCKDILEFANFNAEAVKQSILNCEESEPAFNVSNQILLELLRAYDISKDENLLLNCKEISKYLLKTYGERIIETINYYQIIMRQRGLTNEEIEKLLLLRNEYEPFSLYYTGISILLQNRSDVEYALKKMGSSEKKMIVDYPLFTLYKTYYNGEQ